MKRLVGCISLGVAISLTGCSTLESSPDRYYDLDRQGEYPVAIVPAQFPPQVVVDFGVTGKGSGAAQGAAAGLFGCAEVRDPLGFLLCLPFGVTIGAIYGATEAESADKSKETIGRFQSELERLRTAQTIAHEAADYLGGQDVRAEVVEASAGQQGTEEMPRYVPGQFPGYASVLELRVLELRLESSGQKGAALCLSMTVAARKIDGRTGKERDQLQLLFRLGCRTPEKWRQDGGRPLLEAISTGYASAAREIVDEFYLLYYPRGDAARAKDRGVTATQEQPPEEASSVSTPSAPTFVLRPIQPPLITTVRQANVFSISRPPKSRTASNFVEFADVTTLSPRFEWEPFPRSFDFQAPNAGGATITDVVYDLQVHEGRSEHKGPMSLLPRPVYARFGLRESQHQMEEELSYCSWYFWTVRARFRLNGAPRVTEWAGAYYTAEDWMFPGAVRRRGNPASHSHYYPFRTPADPAWPACWDDWDVYNQRLESQLKSPVAN
jgi:hypothetical protein